MQNDEVFTAHGNIFTSLRVGTMSARPIHLVSPEKQVGYSCQNTDSTDQQLI